jgi:2-polyprenyl-3-methyl-5-hydroxy-6-metoxy-1,4-benzoquinol methylase
VVDIIPQVPKIESADSKSRDLRKSAPPTAANKAPDKCRIFDRYWETRNLTSADMRTRLRITLVESLLSGPGGHLLDVGCGRGAVASHFAERGWRVTATDISPLALQWTQRQHRAITTACVDLETESLPGQHDAVVCLEVLQQVRNPVEVLAKLIDAVRMNGDLIVSLPNEFHLVRRLAIMLGRIDFGGIEDTHIKLYSAAEHLRLFGACGLEVCERRVQSIIPPRWLGGRLHGFGNALAELFPGLFALSVVYKLKRTCS